MREQLTAADINRARKQQRWGQNENAKREKGLGPVHMNLDTSETASDFFFLTWIDHAAFRPRNHRIRLFISILLPKKLCRFKKS